MHKLPYQSNDIVYRLTHTSWDGIRKILDAKFYKCFCKFPFIDVSWFIVQFLSFSGDPIAWVQIVASSFNEKTFNDIIARFKDVFDHVNVTV